MKQEKKFEFHITQEFSDENKARIKSNIESNYTPYEISRVFYEILKKYENLQIGICLALFHINNEEKIKKK